MGRYTIRRLIGLIPTLLAVYTITFLLIHITPGGPWDSDKPLSPEAKAALDKAYGLDKPLWRQYTDYLGNVLHGDFGPSFTQRNRDVSDIVKDFFPVSIKLGLVAIVIAAIVGIVSGTVSAVKQNTPLDYFATFGAIIGISAPSYVIASLLILLLANTLHLVPTGGWGGIFDRRTIIPAIALALGPAAILARYTRSSLLDILRQELCPHGPCEGLARPRGDRAPRPPQCDDSGGDGHGYLLRQRHHRLFLRRGRLRRAGSRELLRQKRDRARLSGDARHDAPLRGHHHGDEYAGRYPLRRPRSAHRL